MTFQGALAERGSAVDGAAPRSPLGLGSDMMLLQTLCESDSDLTGKSKASLSTLAFVGMLTFAARSQGHLPKAPNPMYFTESGSVTLVKERQP